MMLCGERLIIKMIKTKAPFGPEISSVSEECFVLGSVGTT